jgi:hypothetical protein
VRVVAREPIIVVAGLHHLLACQGFSAVLCDVISKVVEFMLANLLACQGFSVVLHDLQCQAARAGTPERHANGSHGCWASVHSAVCDRVQGRPRGTLLDRTGDGLQFIQRCVTEFR